MFLRLVQAIFELDVVFFHSLLFNNLHRLFIFAAVMYFFQNRAKNKILYLTTLVLMLYAFSDVLIVLGWPIPPIMQFGVIVGNVVITSFDDWKIIKNHKSWLALFVFFGLWVLYNTGFL